MTGTFGPAVLLRTAASRLQDHLADVGCDIDGALFTAALELVGRDDAPRAADQAREVLTGFLVEQGGERAEPIRAEVVHRYGLIADLFEITESLYAAAARHDGVDVDPDTSNDLPA